MADRRPRGVPPRRTDERLFDLSIRNLYVRPYLRALSEELAKHAHLNTFTWISVVTNFTAQWEREQNVSFPVGVVEAWAASVDANQYEKFVASMRRAFRVDVSPVLTKPPYDQLLREQITESVRLIKTIPPRFQQGIVERYIKGEQEAPLDLEAREQMFRREGQVAGYNLRRITRDQTNKLHGRLTQARHQEAGIQEYSWETSEDDRVRPSHASKQGQVFRWDSPPPDTGHPGNDIQCRCVAIPAVIAEEFKERYGT